MLEHNLYPILFAIITDKILFTLRASLLLSSSSNDVSDDISEDEGSFEIFLNTEFTSHMYLHIALAIEADAASSCFAQLLQYSQNILKLLTFKSFLNDVLPETEFSEVKLIWWFVSIKSITSFSKLFFGIFFQTMSLLISTSLRKQSLFHLHTSWS